VTRNDLQSMSAWFCYDGETFMTFATEKQAREEAERVLDGLRDAAGGDGVWFEDTGSIAWGRIHQSSKMTVIHEHDASCKDEDSDCGYRSDVDSIVEFNLVDTVALPETEVLAAVTEYVEHRREEGA